MSREVAWLCPECGQWGATEFGTHHLPDYESFVMNRKCDATPVRVVIGPFLHFVRTRSAGACPHHGAECPNVVTELDTRLASVEDGMHREVRSRVLGVLTLAALMVGGALVLAVVWVVT